MNILLINHYAGSPEMGMEFRPYYFAKKWQEMGHKVSVISADYSHLRRKNPNVKRDFQKEVIDGIDYYFIKTQTYDGNGVSRAITMAQFVGKTYLKSRWINKHLQPDVVICSSTYHLDTFAGQHIRKLAKKKVKLVHEAHDVWPATLIEIGGMSKFNPFVLAIQFAENSFCKNSDCVISLPEYARNHYIKHGMNPQKFCCIPLAIDLNEWSNQVQLSKEHLTVINSLKDDGKFIVGYFGGHALSNALDVMLDVVEKCQGVNPNIHFVLVGDGVEKDKLINTARKNNLKNITFLPPVSKKEIPALTSMFDCIYMGTYKSSLYRFGMCMNKMLDSLMTGKPVVSSISSPPTWVDQSGCGISVESENSEQALSAILQIFNMSDEERTDMGERGKRYAIDNFDINILAKKMLDFIMED